jgi:hypothetical protein
MGLLHDLRLPNGVTTTTVGFPVEMTGYEFRVDREPPSLGEHTEEVFRVASTGCSMSDVIAMTALDERGVRQLTLDRGKRANAIDAELGDALLAALKIAHGDATRVLVLRANGKNFCGDSTSPIMSQLRKAICFCDSCASSRRCSCCARRRSLRSRGPTMGLLALGRTSSPPAHTVSGRRRRGFAFPASASESRLEHRD